MHFCPKITFKGKRMGQEDFFLKMSFNSLKIEYIFSKMVGKIVGHMFFCTICPKEYKTNNGLKKHCVTEHTVIGADPRTSL